MGDPNASIPTPQPTRYRPMFGAFGGAVAATSLTFVSQSALNKGLGQRLRITKPLVAVENTRSGLRKANMIHNGATPQLHVDPETYVVTADGVVLTCEPATVLPMAQRFFLF
jgi:urease subunit alpha